MTHSEATHIETTRAIEALQGKPAERDCWLLVATIVLAFVFMPAAVVVGAVTVLRIMSRLHKLRELERQRGYRWPSGRAL